MEELRELLRPGHKMASIMVEQHQAAQNTPDSRYGGENAGSMGAGEQFTGESKPEIGDASKLGGEGDNMGSGTDASGDGVGAPDLDDPSKHGGG